MSVAPNAANNSLVRAVEPYALRPVSSDTYPWINVESTEIPTVLVTLVDGTEFQYGSIVGLNGGIRKIADKVSEDDSERTQRAMFMGLPSVLNGARHQGIRRAENSRLIGGTLFIASRNLVQQPSMVFSVESSESDRLPDTVLRAGSSHANDLDRLLRMMGTRPVGGRGRRS